jgi:hypothetical protein
LGILKFETEKILYNFCYEKKPMEKEDLEKQIGKLVNWAMGRGALRAGRDLDPR